MADRPYDKERLKHLIHYVIWKVGARPGFGATKLYKTAWFSDAKSFVLLGKSITGAQYLRQKYGPIPKYGMQVRSELTEMGYIAQSKDADGHWQFRSLIPPKREWFSAGELEHIDYWADHIANNHTAASISEESHDLGWEIAKMNEVLPFHSVLVSRIREPNERQMEWARRRARELGLP
ncbi:Panacea domain-containing protein [Rhizobium mesosinicum]|uniref:SocA family protein n=1 Tax=Rhizobium mesosinicum TaxID=335017 RepID=A0ABS7GXZ6_9HYPH|nr:Panacea domain-containing protein [Rhizobium mesosinicum]MBW9054844.1 SocA family protein [Rhizobium mesosinicum]